VPGMIGRRYRHRRLVLCRVNGCGDLLAGRHVCLAGLLLVKRIGQLAALIFQSDLTLGIFDHYNPGAPKGAGAAWLSELVDNLVVLQRQVLGHRSRELDRKAMVVLIVMGRDLSATANVSGS
jgi:hypothetical protein